MVGLVFHFEPNDQDVWSGRPIDLDSWRYNAEIFGVKTLIMIDKVPGGTNFVHENRPNEGMQIFKFPDIEDFLKQYPKEEKVWFETEWTIPENIKRTKLNDFKHPKDNVFYILGPAGGFKIPPDDKRTWVTIPQVAKFATHSNFIAPIILYDRALKLKTI